MEYEVRKIIVEKGIELPYPEVRDVVSVVNIDGIKAIGIVKELGYHDIVIGDGTKSVDGEKLFWLNEIKSIDKIVLKESTVNRR